MSYISKVVFVLATLLLIVNGVAAQTPEPPKIVKMSGVREVNKTVTYTEQVGGTSEGSYVQSVAGNTITISGIQNYTRYNQCPTKLVVSHGTPFYSGYRVFKTCQGGEVGWWGNFRANSPVLAFNEYTGPPDPTIGDMYISFSSPVTEAGFKVQSSHYENQTFRLTAFDGTTELGVVEYAGPGWYQDVGSESTAETNDWAPFIGVRATCGNKITKMRVDRLGNAIGAIGPISFGSYSIAMPTVAPKP